MATRVTDIQSRRTPPKAGTRREPTAVEKLALLAEEITGEVRTELARRDGQ